MVEITDEAVELFQDLYGILVDVVKLRLRNILLVQRNVKLRLCFCGRATRVAQETDEFGI